MHMQHIPHINTHTLDALCADISDLGLKQAGLRLS